MGKMRFYELRMVGSSVSILTDNMLEVAEVIKSVRTPDRAVMVYEDGKYIGTY